MSPETGSLLLLLLFCAGATAVNPLTTTDPTEDKEALGILISRGKPGTCPENVNYPVNGPVFQHECKSDRNCKENMKCCFSGGRRRCLLPLDAKDNACPYFDESKCWRVKPEPFECHSDDQCQGTERCCYYGCRLQCMPTVKVKCGTCPKHGKKCGFPPPTPKCKSDGDCPGKQKCCTPRCYPECTNPSRCISSCCCPRRSEFGIAPPVTEDNAIHEASAYVLCSYRPTIPEQEVAGHIMRVATGWAPPDLEKNIASRMAK